MAVLLLRLAGPMQSWGIRSKLKDRESGEYPSKSGVIGLIAAAQGRSRTDDLSDLASLPFGVGIRRPGIFRRDTQTAVKGKLEYKGANDNERYFFWKGYIEDAIFFCGIDCDKDLAEKLSWDLQHPAYPLYLGRRGCPVTQPLVVGIVEKPLEEALTQAIQDDPYDHNVRKLPFGAGVLLLESDKGMMVRDVPVSFSFESREYAGRMVERKGGGDVSQPGES
jgi:CRISPR system Cascade subunit CasD